LARSRPGWSTINTSTGVRFRRDIRGEAKLIDLVKPPEEIVPCPRQLVTS
jgi:hypothetical protein